MNDTLREYLSFGKFIGPLIRTHKEIEPDEVVWGDKDQFFTFFESPCKKENKLVIYIHAGGWDHNSPHNLFFIGQRIAKEGYDCVMYSYRKTPKHRYPEILDDIFQDYVRTKNYLNEKDKYYEKRIVMGSSAGGHLGALLCFDRQKQEEYQISADEFAGLISLAGPVCFEYPHTATVNAMLKELFDSKEPTDWKVGEPYDKLYTIPGFKVCVIQSRHDGLVGFEQAEAFCEKAKALGMESEFYEVTDGLNTHSAYCEGIFLQEIQESATLQKTLEMLERM